MSSGRLFADPGRPFIKAPTGIAVQPITDPERLKVANWQMYESTCTRDIRDEDAPKPGEVAWARDNVWAIYDPEAPGKFTFWEPVGVDPAKKGIWAI
jgi:hypothetical protein